MKEKLVNQRENEATQRLAERQLSFSSNRTDGRCGLVGSGALGTKSHYLRSYHKKRQKKISLVSLFPGSSFPPVPPTVLT